MWAVEELPAAGALPRSHLPLPVCKPCHSFYSRQCDPRKQSWQGHSSMYSSALLLPGHPHQDCPCSRDHPWGPKAPHSPRGCQCCLPSWPPFSRITCPLAQTTLKTNPATANFALHTQHTPHQGWFPGCPLLSPHLHWLQTQRARGTSGGTWGNTISPPHLPGAQWDGAASARL